MSGKNPHAGGDFDDFLKEEGVYARTVSMARARAKAQFLMQRLPAMMAEYFLLSKKLTHQSRP
jgi:hypothetical protein